MPGVVMAEPDPAPPKALPPSTEHHNGPVDEAQSILTEATAAPVNGILDAPPDTTSLSTNAMTDTLDQLPPEIQHITVGYQPLSKLYSRAVQDCYNDLTNLISDLADSAEAPPSTAQVNGTTAIIHLSHAQSQRRIRWMEMAHKHRQRFIKILVLSQWSAKSALPVSKLVDLHVWAVGQLTNYEESAMALADLRRSLDDARLMRPDIDTALEILSTGKSTRMPELDYIPPAPLSPQKLLKTLRNLNTLLSIRLNLHETLPPPFRDFTIASGRATFTVPDEFEVDVSLTSDDPSNQLYFVDFRFLLHPRLEIPNGPVRANLELLANEVLRTDGLTGLYSYLHDFVLTHKINLLRQQALELSRSAWTGSLRVEQVHRSLILHYWVRRPGPKSWVEIGVSSGKSSSGHDAQPRLAVRWMRSAKEVVDAGVELDPQNLSVDRILEQVTARHISHILSQVYNEYKRLPASAEAAQLFLETSDTDPSRPELHIPLTMTQSTVVLIEPVTGQFALQPPTPASTRCEESLSRLRDPANEAYLRIRNWQAAELQGIAIRYAERAGWMVVRNLHISTEAVKLHFGSGIVLLTFFKGVSWHSEWTVAFSVGVNGVSWWIVQLSQSVATTTATSMSSNTSTSILTSRALPCHDEFGSPLPLSAGFFLSLQRLAAAMISFWTISRQLTQLNVPHAFDVSSHVRHKPVQRALAINLPSLVAQGGSQQASLAPWASKSLWLSHHGFTNRKGIPGDTKQSVQHVVRGRMQRSKPLCDLLSKTGASDVALDPSGAFAILIESPLGAPIVDQIVNRLHGLMRLRSYLEVLHAHRYECVVANLSEIVFNCGSVGEQVIQATIPFRHVGHLEPSFRFASQEGSSNSDSSSATRTPFTRVRNVLTETLNHSFSHKEDHSTREKSSSSSTSARSTHPPPMATTFAAFTRALQLSLPILRALDAIEAADPTGTAVLVHPRTLGFWHLQYRYPAVTFAATVKVRRGQAAWLVQVVHPNNPPTPSTHATNGTTTTTSSPALLAVPQPLQADLLALFATKPASSSTSTSTTATTTPPPYIGLRRALVATPQGIEAALLAIDSLMRRYTAEYRVKARADAAAAAAAPPPPPVTASVDIEAIKVAAAPKSSKPAATTTTTTTNNKGVGKNMPNGTGASNAKGAGNGSGNAKVKTEVVVLD